MRKLIVIALFAAGLSGCAGGTPAPSEAAPTSAAADAETAAACAEARTATTAAIADLQAIYVDTGGVAPTDPVRRDEVLDRSTKVVNDWINTFADLSNRAITPQLKQALTDSIDAINSLLSRITTLTPADGLATITEVNNKIDGACAD